MDDREISIEMATKLLKGSNSLFTEVLKHGTLVVEFYKPDKVDNQKPHDKDEIMLLRPEPGFLIMEAKGGISSEGTFCSFLLALNIDSKNLRTTFQRGYSFTDLLEERK
jgi:hypothetical protein